MTGASAAKFETIAAPVSGLSYRSAFKVAGLLGRCAPRDTIVLAGSPRSGTTIVEEIYATLPGYKTLNEPLLQRWVQAAYGFTNRSCIPVDAVAPLQESFMRRVLTGQLGAAALWAFESTSRTGRLKEHASKRKLVVKFCRLNRMLPWFCRNFERKGVVLIIRHPCSVVSSMLKHGPWDDMLAKRTDPFNPLAWNNVPAGARPVFGPMMDRIETLEEALAAMWALDQWVPLIEAEHRPWILLPYERLVLNPRQELDRVNSALGIETSDAMIARLARPSSSVKVKEDLLSDSRAQLGKWRDTLKPAQIDGILRIVRQAGLGHIYSDAVEPDYDALNACQDPSCRW
ncbi:MAG TPA: sulfotransferase [Novosphingobium sp.]|nr:sulfotransferase [Novosphingobium sp.]